ncbi:hypothetical protein ACFFRR_011242 [Megaselia abdita]
MRLLQFCVGLFTVTLVSACGENFGDIIWVNEDDFVPPDQIYICRGHHEGETLIGTYFAGENTKSCLVSQNNRVIELESFEVLKCAESGIWTPVLGNILPSNVFSFDGEKIIHACRDVNSNPTIGTVKKATCSEDSCLEKSVCEIVVFESKISKIVSLDRFTVFTVTNTMIETDLNKNSENYSLKEPLQIRTLSFNVKAKEQITILFKSDAGKLLFEILIGGLQNSITAIRKGGYDMFSNTTHTMSVLEEESFMSFWVYWEQGGLAVGRADKYLEPLESTNAMITLRDSGVFGITKYSVKSSLPTSWNFWL